MIFVGDAPTAQRSDDLVRLRTGNHPVVLSLKYTDWILDLLGVKDGRTRPVESGGLWQRTQQEIGIARLEFMGFGHQSKLVGNAIAADAGLEETGKIFERLQHGKSPGAP